MFFFLHRIFIHWSDRIKFSNYKNNSSTLDQNPLKSSSRGVRTSRSMGMCISSTFSSDNDTAGVETTPEEPLPYTPATLAVAN